MIFPMCSLEQIYFETFFEILENACNDELSGYSLNNILRGGFHYSAVVYRERVWVQLV